MNMELLEKVLGCRPKAKLIQFAKNLSDVPRTKEKSIKYPCYGSEKFDGVYCMGLKVDEGKVIILSRTGQIYTSMKHIEKELNEILKVAEIVIFEAYNYYADQPTISGWARDTKEQHTELVGLTHDLLIVDEFVDSGGRIYSERFKELYSRFQCPENNQADCNVKYGDYLELIPHTPIDNPLHALAVADGLMKLGAEGLILKNPNAYYQGGKRNLNIIKIKEKITYDLKVIGLTNGTGKYENMVGAVVCKFKNGLSIKAGSGLTDEQRKAWKEDPSLILGKIVEIKAMKDSTKGSVREGVFKGVRYDKEEADF